MLKVYNLSQCCALQILDYCSHLFQGAPLRAGFPARKTSALLLRPASLESAEGVAYYYIFLWSNNMCTKQQKAVNIYKLQSVFFTLITGQSNANIYYVCRFSQYSYFMLTFYNATKISQIPNNPHQYIECLSFKLYIN